MSKSLTLPTTEKFDLNKLIEDTKIQLSASGYEVTETVLNEKSASMTVCKDNDGIKKLSGLGVECNISFTAINPTTLTINIESTWTNKIIAIAIGWFLCLIPLITGVVGCVNQSELPKKITSTIQTAAAGMN